MKRSCTSAGHTSTLPRTGGVFAFRRVAVLDSNRESHGILAALTATRAGRAHPRANSWEFSLRCSRKGKAGWHPLPQRPFRRAMVQAVLRTWAQRPQEARA